MDRPGRVRQLFEDSTALVIFTDGCALRCDQCNGCQRPFEGVIAQNPQNADPGELVLVHRKPGKVLLAAWMLLLQPTVNFFAGYWLGAVLGNAGKLTGCLALAVSIGIGLVYDRCSASKRGSGYTIIKYPQNINKRG